MGKFSDAAKVSMVLWNMRQADLPRASNRTVLNRLYNGDPPFDEATAEQNGVQINRNFLEGTNLLHQARGQWNNAFLKPGDYFSIKLDGGPAHKRREWSQVITQNLNRRLKRNARWISLLRSTGANVVLHGIAPANWPNRKAIIPTPLMVPSLLIPSETDIDFENLEYFAIFREYTPTQLYDLTHGTKVDPGWNMPLVKEQLRLVAEKYRKEPNSIAYQYMPERIEELIKQDKGYWASDAVPTIDIWDFYYREAEDGCGWYRKIILDWFDGTTGIPNEPPEFKDTGFLYDSGNRTFANKLSEILHCQFGDCSAVAPFKYHSVRSLGWMLWGVCDLQNRLRCKFTESVFEQCMWFFRTSNQNQFERIKKANFTHMGVIPDGIAFVTADQRFKPDAGLMEMAFQSNRQIMAENASSFIQDFQSGGDTGKPMTATETMARVNTVNALVSSMLGLAYTYHTFLCREISRRFCIKDGDIMAREFRKDCLKAGVPEEMLDAERWDIEPERVLGGGNKTLAIAQVNQLLSMRQFFGPDGQRLVDNIAVATFTDDAALAESIAPLGQQKYVSQSQNEAQLLTPRIMQGLRVLPPKDAVYEDYILVWLNDLTQMVAQVSKTTNMPTVDQLIGFGNMAQHIEAFLQVLSQDQTAKEKVRQYGDALGQVQNLLKGFAQRLQESMQQPQNGNGGMDPAALGKVQAMLLQAQTKSKIQQESHAQKTAQKQVAFEMEQQRQDRKQMADIRRQTTQTEADIAMETARMMSEPTTPQNAEETPQ